VGLPNVVDGRSGEAAGCVFRLEETAGLVLLFLEVVVLGLKEVCVGVVPTRPFDPCASITEAEQQTNNITTKNLLISRSQNFRQPLRQSVNKSINSET
jgi:hypothetical protein